MTVCSFQVCNPREGYDSNFCKNHTKCMYSLHMIKLKWFKQVESL